MKVAKILILLLMAQAIFANEDNQLKTNAEQYITEKNHISNELSDTPAISIKKPLIPNDTSYKIPSELPPDEPKALPFTEYKSLSPSVKCDNSCYNESNDNIIKLIKRIKKDNGNESYSNDLKENINILEKLIDCKS